MLGEDIRHLAVEIGPRFGGSKGEHKAARYIERRLSSLGLETEIQEFQYVGWKLVEAPRVQILSPESRILECAPLLYSSSTPRDGVAGIIKPAGTRQIIPGLYDFPQYDLVDDRGKILANLIVETRGKAVPFLNPRSLFLAPQFVIGNDDHQYIQSKLKANMEVRAKVSIRTKFKINTSYNVIGRYRKSQRKGRTVVCAHYDTTLDTPGAYDNASGVAAMIATAENCLTQKLERNIDFIAFSCEEIGILGSDYYVNNQKERKLIDDVEFCLDYDQVSGGDLLWIWAGPPGYATKVQKKIERMGLPFECKIDPPMAGSDSWKFHQQGIPSALIMFWRQPEYHKPSDTFDKVDTSKAEMAVKIGLQLLASR